MRRLLRLRHRSRREWLSAALVAGGLCGFVGLTYLVVVLGGGLLLGHTSAPDPGLSVLATALVALGFDPVLGRLDALATRVVWQGRPSPYDALRRLSSAAGDQTAESLPLHMARLLQEGTGAEWAQVWVAVAGQPVEAATWPPEAEARLIRSPDWDYGTRRLIVRHGAEELGLLMLREPAGAPMTPVEERLFVDLADQAGLVLRGAQLRAALGQRLSELSAREAELRESLERVVDAQDEARRRLERDIHDGAQQHLVALAVNLRLAADLASDPARAVPLLAAQESAAQDAIETVLQLAHGIYPGLVERRGVAAALRTVVTDPAVEVVERGSGRYPVDLEATAYFCCLEALQNAAKHAGATTVRVELLHDAEGLTLTVTDDGVGFDPELARGGSGMANLRDRVDSAGGVLEVTSAPGKGTRVRASFPAPVPASVGQEG
jgi:signal transduction histidine kinase